MSSLNKLAIRGIRSFDDKQVAIIEFFSPVTVIVGHNGSGKTTIIECLKYATTGDQPPNTRGGAFIHDPKMANEKEVKAQVKLRFHAANGQRMLAVRNLSVTVKKTASLTMKTLESILSLDDEHTNKSGKRATISTKCAEMDTEIPNLLGVSKAVLENVIFCHQEDSYWPLAEPAALKKKFDDIFEATRYSKALDSIKSLRKDRVAELKVDKERLEGLSQQKSHADKLKKRISELNNTIAMKEMKLEELQNEYDILVKSNKRFYDSAVKFRDMFNRMENLDATIKRLQGELREAKETTEELPDTDEQLDDRIANHDKHAAGLKERHQQIKAKLEDGEENVASIRKEQLVLQGKQGELVAQRKRHEENIKNRDAQILHMATDLGLAGFEHPPFERDKIVAFMERVAEMREREAAELKGLQSEATAKSEEYHKSAARLQAENSNLQNEKTRLRNHIRSLQESISKTEKELEGLQNLDTELLHHNTRMEDKQNRLEMIKNDTKSSDYDGKVNQLIVKKKGLEAQRETLDTELRTINRQADDRAKLGFKRDEHKSKSQEIANIVSIHNAKFRQLVGSEIKPDSMLRDLDRSISDKDGERDEAENEYSTLNSTYQLADSTLASSKADLKKKQEELKAAERKLQGALLDHKSVKAAVSEATTELNLRTTEGGSMAGANEIYASLLKTGKAKKTCTACNRPLGDHEMDSFENHLTALINKNTPEKIAENLQEAVEWQEELKRLQTLLPIENTRDLLKSKEIPRIESLIKEQEEKLPNINATVEKALEKVTHLKKELKEMSLLRQQSLSMSRLQVDTGRIQQEISDIEERLTASGSVKDIKDVQEDIDKIAESIRVCERDINTVAAERDRQLGLARTYESELLKMQLDTSNLQSRLRDKSALETRVKTDLEGVSKANQELKDAESKVSKAQAPLNDLTRQHSESQRQYDERIEKLQKRVEELTRKEDTLKTSSKEIYDYVRNKYSRALEECNERLDNLASEIKDVERDIDDMRSSKSELEKEMNDGGASVVKLYQNRRIRKLRLDIAKIQEEIDSIDMEEASKARRNFDTKFKIEKERETHLGGECGRLSGELSSLKAQVKTVEGDLKEFKDITKRYTEQLVKVKMSDMANNDLEKYSKALDNAIMKYHSLKMEEVNDIMRHLWNKTYQGTDIDGIKIRSDVEGGASKRSYNYRVVMTKDQVEMDMRGRCSAGQKMLASIIIRLALSDSFGQNCGILALDEPTNALDTDNIDALAASLVDIINERKNYSNFQLIIITHDENFLSKLGQADVMEHYWRVSRDERQKSVIQRQRFG